MNPWHLLEISPTIDIKEIKRAYAKKLKITKPDEDQKAFQLLYEAYQLALRHAARKVAVSNQISILDEEVELPQSDIKNSQIVIQPLNASLNQDVLIEQDPLIVQEAVETEYQLRLTEYNHLIQQVESLLQAHEIGPELGHWYFISQSPYILEDEFNGLLGRQVFKLFAEYLKQKYRSRKNYYYRYISHSIINHCDQIFSWSNHTKYLESEYGSDLCEKIFLILEELSENKVDMGIRGGTFVRTPDGTSANQKSIKNDDSIGGATIIQILFFLMIVVNLLRHLVDK